MTNLFEKKIDSREIYKGKIITVRRDTIALANGNQAVREVVNNKGGVVIVAEDNNKILMVKQFRYPTNEILYELPAGKLDVKNESLLSAARRELEEETGYVAEHWEPLGFIWSSPGFCDEKLHIFKATGLTFVGQKTEKDEILEFMKINKEKVFDMIKYEIINDSKSIAALMRAYLL